MNRTVSDNFLNLQHVVLDEADEMLNMGFADDIEELFSRYAFICNVEIDTIKRFVFAIYANVSH